MRGTAHFFLKRIQQSRLVVDRQAGVRDHVNEQDMRGF